MVPWICCPLRANVSLRSGVNLELDTDKLPPSILEHPRSGIYGTMKRLNLKFLALLLIPVGLAAIGIHFLHDNNVKRTEEMWLDAANKAEAAGKLPEALNELAKYLRENPSDLANEQRAAMIAAEVFLAKDGRTTSNLGTARGRLEKAARLSSDEPEKKQELERKLINVLVEAGKMQDAYSYIKPHILLAPSDADLFYKAGQCTYYLEIDSATESPDVYLSRVVGLMPKTKKGREFDEDAALDPHHVDAYALLADYLQEKGESTALATLVIEEMVRVNKEHEDRSIASRAFLHRGRHRQAYPPKFNRRSDIVTHLDAVRADITKAVELDPRNGDALLTLADLDIAAGDPEAAKVSLRAALEVNPESVLGHLQLAGIFQTERKEDEAMAIVEAGLKHAPTNVELLWRKCLLQITTRDSDGLRRTIAKLKSTQAESDVIAVAEACLPMCKRGWAEASRRLRRVAPVVVRNDTLREAVDRSLAICYGHTREWDRQLEIYETLAKNPSLANSDDLFIGRVNALLKLRRLIEAKALLRSRILQRRSGEKVPEGISSLIARFVRLSGGSTDDFLTDAEEESELKPEELEGEPEDWIAAPIGFWLKVSDRTNRILESDAEDKQAQARDLWARALALYGDAINNMSGDQRERALTVWRSNYYTYVGAMLSQVGPHEAIESLEKMRSTHGDSQGIITQHANILVSKKMLASDNDSLEKLRELESRIPDLPYGERATAWIQLGSAFAKTGDAGMEDSKRCWKNAAELEPSDKFTLRQLFDLARQADDKQGMLAALDTIEAALTREDAVWKYGRAQYLTSLSQDKKNPPSEKETQAYLDQALSLVEEALKDRHTWGTLYHLRGYIRELQGDLDGALADYERAQDEGLNDASLRLHLAGLRISRNEFTAAADILDGIPEGTPGLARLQAMLLAIRGHNPKQIVEAIDKLAVDDSDWMLQIEIGEMLRRASERLGDDPESKALLDRAESSFRAALAAEPEVPGTWLLLVRFFVDSRKDEAAARELLENGEKELSGASGYRTLAECYIRLKDVAKAEHYLKAVLTETPGDLAALRGLADQYIRTGREADGVQVLDEMLAFSGKENSYTRNHIAWARRRKAGELLRTRRHADFLAAVALVEENRKASSNSVEDTLVKAQVLSTRPEPRYQRQAIDLIEQVRQQDASALDFDFVRLLARLQFQDARTSDAEAWTRSRTTLDLLIDPARQRRDRRTAEQKTELLIQFATMLLDRNELSQANHYISNLSRTSPKDERTIRLAAKMHMAKKTPDTKSATNTVNSIIPKQKTSAESARSLLFAARLFDELGLHKEAEEAFRRLAREQPIRLVTLAKYLASRGRVKDALSIARQMAQSGNVDYACGIGLLAVRKQPQVSSQQKEEILGWFKKAKQKGGPAGVRIAMIEAELFIVLGEEERAIAQLQDLLGSNDRTEAEEGEIANNLAYLFAARGEELDQALQLIDKAIELLGPSVGLLDTKGVVHLARDECDEALEALTEATSMDANPTYSRGFLRAEEEATAHTHFHLALAYRCRDDMVNARKALTSARKRGFRAAAMIPLRPERLTELKAWLGDKKPD